MFHFLLRVKNDLALYQGAACLFGNLDQSCDMCRGQQLFYLTDAVKLVSYYPFDPSLPRRER